MILVGAVFAATLLFAVGGLGWLLYKERSKNQQLVRAKIEQEKFLQDFVLERAEIEAYNEWESTYVPWLDEFYDLSARFPFEPGFRVNKLSAQPIAVKRGAKETAIAIAPGRFDPDESVETMLDRFFDLYVMEAMQFSVDTKLGRYPMTAEQGHALAKERLERAYAWLDGHMANRVWAAGDDYTLADCAAYPLAWPSPGLSLRAILDSVPGARKAKPVFECNSLRLSDGFVPRWALFDPIQGRAKAGP